MDFKIHITKQGAFFDGTAPDVINAALGGAMYEATQLLEAEVKKNTPRGVFGAQGGLLSTIHGEVVGKGTPVIKGIVGTQSKYGEVVEKGRTPGAKMPPAGALIQWMELKLGMDAETARKKEFVIRRKIGKKGFKGARMFEQAFDNNFEKLTEIFDRKGFLMARALDGK
ncbi:hypothetical protein EPN18_07385 [bacterium]|nr:MAG: hypothetical protein EPN18_07385 [bacterium]